MKTVLFACVHNAGRSQMSNALFNHLVDPEIARGISAGTQPGTKVHPEVLVAMSELDVDLSSVQPQLLTPELAASADLLITMGCGAFECRSLAISNFSCSDCCIQEFKIAVTYSGCPSIGSDLPWRAGEACPYVPGLKRLDWPLEDPKVSPLILFSMSMECKTLT